MNELLMLECVNESTYYLHDSKTPRKIVLLNLFQHLPSDRKLYIKNALIN